MLINSMHSGCVRPPHFFDAAQARAKQRPATHPAPAADPTTGAGEIAQLGGFKTGIADIIRGIGAGYLQSGEQMGAVSEKGYSYPLEGVQTATSALADATKKVKYVGKATGYLNQGVALGGRLHSGQISGMLKAPGQTVNDMAQAVADKIDGQKTFDDQWGVELGITATAPANEPGGIGSMLIGLGAQG